MNAPVSSDEDISCRTKIGYPTEHQAKKVWKQLHRQPGRQHLVVYKCDYCSGWHLGNTPGHATYKRTGSPPLNPPGRRAAA